MNTASSIINYYSSIDPSDPSQDREAVLRNALEVELAKNILMVEDRALPTRGARRLPVALLVASLVFSTLTLGFSVKQYNVKMETLFFQPTSLFNTEALLIEALRKRVDLEISKRDRMIAEYRRRAALREHVQELLPLGESVPDLKKATSVPAAIAPDPALEKMRSKAEMESLYAQRLEQALVLTSRQLAAADAVGAELTLTDLSNSLKQGAARDSKVVGASLGIASALSAAIATIQKKLTAVTPPKLVYVADPAQEEALKRLRAENIALLDRILVLEAQRAPMVMEQPASVSGPSGAFLGTISLVSGARVLVDLAQGTAPKLGDRAEVYRTEQGGATVLLGEGVISVLRGSTAELRLSTSKAAPTTRPRVQDTVYLVQRER